MNQKHLSFRAPRLGFVGSLLLLGLAAQAQDFTNGLTAYWTFDQSNFKDSIGILDGTALGGPIEFLDGKPGFGKAIKLNGASTQCVEIQAGDPDALAFADGSVSISCWFTVDSFDKSWQALVAKGEGSNWRLARRSDETGMAYAGGAPDTPSGPFGVNDGGWHHMVAISDAAAVNFGTAVYMDGVLYSMVTNVPVLTANGLAMRIGDNPTATGRTWTGNIDDVAIWSRVLTPTEISEIYSAGTGLPISALLVDTDHDGMPNAWEIQYGLNPNDPSDAALDANSNGISNLDEFKRGLDPTDTTKPAIVSAVAASTFDKVTVTFSKRLDTATATNVANYAISPALVVSNATVNLNVVTLTTEKQTAGAVAYTLTVNNVKDVNNFSIAADSKSVFYSYLLQKTGISSGLRSYWNFDSTLNDTVGSANGTEHGGNPIAYVDSWSTNFGKAIELDGIDQYVTAGDPNQFAFAGGSVSIASWFKVTAFDKDWQAMIAQGEGNSWRIARRGGESDMSYAGGLGDTPSSTTLVDDGNWHHLVAVSDSSGAAFGGALYIDGKLDVTSPGVAALVGNGQQMMIGNNPGSPARSWNGDLDEVAIWNRVLTASEITNLYSSGKPLSQLLSSTTDVPFPPEGKFSTQFPAPNAINILVDSTINIVHQDGKTAWASTNVTMNLDGQPVIPQFSKNGDLLTIKYKPATLLTGNATHTIALNNPDPGGNPTVTSWTFKTYGFNGFTKDTVKNYQASLQGNARYTTNSGGATGLAGDYAIDLTTRGGPILVKDTAFLTNVNSAVAADELSVSVWLKKYDIADSWAVDFASPTQAIVFKAEIPWSNDEVSFDTSGCCDATTQRINQNISSAPGYTDDTWWNQWRLFVLTKKGTLKNIYIDGVLFTSGNNTLAMTTGVNQFTVGSDNTVVANLMHSLVDDVAVYSKELTPDNVTALKSGTKPSALPASAGLIAYWDFNDVSTQLPTLSATYAAGILTMTYTGTLVSAPSPTGPWTSVTGASSPWPVTPSKATAQIYYRAQQ